MGVADGLSEYWPDRRKEEVEVEVDRNEVVERSENSDDPEESNMLRSGKRANMEKRDWGRPVTDVTLVSVDRIAQEKINCYLRLTLRSDAISDGVAISLSQSD
jgi:hypothetical protein